MKVLTILSTVFLALAVNAAVVRDTTNVLAVQDCEDRCRHDQEDCLRRIDDHYDHRDRPHREHERERECKPTPILICTAVFDGKKKTH